MANNLLLSHHFLRKLGEHSLRNASPDVNSELDFMTALPKRFESAGAQIEELSNGVLARLNVPVWIFDIDNARVVQANPAACALWQAETEDELCNRDFSADMSTTVSNRLRQYQIDFETQDTSFSELWTLYPNGLPRSVMVVFRGVRLADGRMAMLCEAISEAEDTPENLRSAEALLHTDVMIVLFSREGPPLYLNPAARKMFTTPSATLAGVLADPHDMMAITGNLQTRGEFRMVARVRTHLGLRWYDLTAKRCLDAATGELATLVTAIDVSELTEARDTARKLANIDQLTGLYNRSYLQRHLDSLDRSNVADQCAIVFFDIDRFKTINDRYGHDAGDKVLRNFASRAKARLRENDVIARLGGDEFIVLFEGVKDVEEVEKRANDLCAAMRRPFIHGDLKIDTSVSVGLTLFTPDGADFDAVLREADLALYASKLAGRDRATVFTEEMGIEAQAREELEIALRKGLDEGQFALHYQPRLDVRSGRIVAVEGLVRWNHPEKGSIRPGVFIPMCEENGLIESLGRTVLKLGVAQAIEWAKLGLNLNVSLNVSPRQFVDPRFMDTLQELSKLPGFPAGKIELEITESVLSGRPEMVVEQLRQINDIGYRIAVDDFGTGYSNLSSIWRFPLACLKIDQSFIAQLPDAGPIVRMIISLGEQIGAVVVGEGVENAEQLGWLADNNCTQAQGYFIAKPMPPEDFLRLFERGLPAL